MSTSSQPASRFSLLPQSYTLLGLLIVMYGPLMAYWVHGWLNKSISIQHEYFSHGLIGIPFAAYMAWGERSRWQQLPDKLHPAGLCLLILGGGLYFSQLSDWMNISLPLVIAGLCLGLKGVSGLKLMSLPLLLVVLATPSQMPYLIEPYILPLQEFIANVAGFLLMQGGIDVTVDQIYLRVNDQMVEVAPHCAGLKMLFTSLYVALILAHWNSVWRSRFRVGVFFTATVVLSVVANIIRNTALSYFHGTGRNAAFHWLHESWGGDLYSAIMLVSLIFLLQLIQQYVPEDLSVNTNTESTI
ncbi:cyanoexosortase B [Oscillatoria sp. CS-180]|uniref:cyanoexosortase B n=1 Tax=Oscillatoria sp. CS-180 TaxID=3021720 RepID=UPI00232BDC97|nr:cyanoexosortase B [Oscillatoria sp. CS-180]MDB9528030.1 cyanoexosortase B [Oscillatoria sp. CS-180]